MEVAQELAIDLQNQRRGCHIAGNNQAILKNDQLRGNLDNAAGSRPNLPNHQIKDELALANQNVLKDLAGKIRVMQNQLANIQQQPPLQNVEPKRSSTSTKLFIFILLSLVSALSITYIRDNQSRIERLTKKIANQKSIIDQQSSEISENKDLLEQKLATMSREYQNLNLQVYNLTKNLTETKQNLSTLTIQLGLNETQTQSVQDEISQQSQQISQLSADVNKPSTWPPEAIVFSRAGPVLQDSKLTMGI
eukprot:TCONS_00055583-protein